LVDQDQQWLAGFAGVAGVKRPSKWVTNVMTYRSRANRFPALGAFAVNASSLYWSRLGKIWLT
jgi:hypothetical protein